MSIDSGFAMPAGRGHRVDGGLIVDGRWSWGSGTHHCTWIGGGVLIEGEGALRLVEAIGRAQGLGQGYGPVDHGWSSRDPEAFAAMFARWKPG
mgnify:CR=1 FL=1